MSYLPYIYKFDLNLIRIKYQNEIRPLLLRDDAKGMIGGRDKLDLDLGVCTDVKLPQVIAAPDKIKSLQQRTHDEARTELI